MKENQKTSGSEVSYNMLRVVMYGPDAEVNGQIRELLEDLI